MEPGSAGPRDTGAILDRIRGGEAAAWAALQARHDGPLRLYVRARLGASLARSVEVDDIVQETWIRAFGALDRFEGRAEGDLRRWLATLARHALADAARAARAAKRDAGRSVRLERTDWGTSGAGPAAQTAGPVTRTIRSERGRLLEEAYASLSASHRRVLALRQFEGRPAREVAGLLGSTEGAVHALYRRALTAWGEAYEALGGRTSA